ncbi:hypothetical protein D6779_12050 [Candidatus Parcubacteria bacterium]|nr:MAG: hypothetical protein D6779_12050 [Candidatus Parcubacteria bacterium]
MTCSPELNGLAHRQKCHPSGKIKGQAVLCILKDKAATINIARQLDLTPERTKRQLWSPPSSKHKQKELSVNKYYLKQKKAPNGASRKMV